MYYTNKIIWSRNFTAIDADFTIIVAKTKRTGWAYEFNPMSDAVMEVSEDTGRFLVTVKPIRSNETEATKELSQEDAHNFVTAVIDDQNRQFWFAKDMLLDHLY